MSKKLLYSFFIICLIFGGLCYQAQGYWEIDGDYVIYDVLFNEGNYYYHHNQTSYNSSMVYIQIYHNRSNFYGYSIRNPVHLNSSIWFVCLMEDSGTPDPVINLQYDIMVNLVPELTIYDSLEENWIPESADYTKMMLSSDYLQQEVIYEYFVVNITSNSTYTDKDFVIGIWGFSFFRAEIYGFYENALSQAFLTIIPVVLIMFLFPMMLRDSVKKYGVILGLFVGIMVLLYTGQIDMSIGILMLLGSGIIGYYYIKKIEVRKIEMV